MHRLLRTLLLLLLAGGLAGQPGAAAQSSPSPAASFSLTTERDPVLTLTGLFRFQPGDDPRWSDPAFDDSRWALVRGDRRWDRIGYPNLSGPAWYRFSVTLPPGDAPTPFSCRISTPAIRCSLTASCC